MKVFALVVTLTVLFTVVITLALMRAISHGGQNSGYGKPSRWRRSR